jgi:replication-associated recombination protein RarA
LRALAQYADNFEENVTDVQCLPDNLSERTLYNPGEQGFENRLRARMEEIRKLEVRGAGK